MVKAKIDLSGVDQVKLFGMNDVYLRLLRDRFGAKIIARGEEVIIEGNEDQVSELVKIFDTLIASVKRGTAVEESDIISASTTSLREQESTSKPEDMYEYRDLKKLVRAKTSGQQQYVNAMRNFDIVFAIGPAGTGKTYLAMAQAVSSLQRRDVDRILLVRPAVEAGESLGFLPGDYTEKVGPYLRPLYDALYEMMPAEKIRKRLDMGIIEVAPLAYMRGRTLNNSFVILDEAQNTTLDQMKMFLTRLGFNSKAVITGDITQIDLARKEESGLVLIQDVLKAIRGIKFVYLTGEDVVRHHLVQEIISAFDRYESLNRRKRRS
ncbi:MAG: PhoH family protein [bacterium]